MEYYEAIEQLKKDLQPLTYREAIQELQQRLEIIYDAAGWMRDLAETSEKESWNNLRTFCREGANSMAFLDRTLQPRRAAFKLK
jgi:hypothetical protein